MRYNREKLLKGVVGVKRKLIAGLAALVILVGCAVKEATYHQISQEEAKRMMDTQNVIILDVREQHEYEASRIPDAVLLPVGTIDEESAAAVIPEKDSVVLVYCRSGNRSKTASSALAELGYTQIYEFGGINTWPYGVMEKLPEVTITSP